MKYIIGSGWWCSMSKDKRDVFYGSDEIRSVNFHSRWKKSIFNNSSPSSVIIIDSDSPISPPPDDNIIFLSLNENAGHSTNHKGKYCGWTRSVIVSMTYAQNCDCDYFVYIEQDVLLKGNGIIEYCIEKMKGNYMFGQCIDHKNPLQQSFFIIKKDAIDQFLSNLYKISYTDNKCPPERKFALATSPLFNFIPKFLFCNPSNPTLYKILRRFQNKTSRIVSNFQYLPIGYGRDRPILFEDKYLYFQHGSLDEITQLDNILTQGENND